MLESGLNTGFFAYLLISRHNSLRRGFGKSGTIWAPQTFLEYLSIIKFVPFLSGFFNVTFGRASIGRGSPLPKWFCWEASQILCRFPKWALMRMCSQVFKNVVESRAKL